MWPAIAVIVGFAWMELVYIFPDRDQPSTLAALSLAYFLAMLAGMALFGVEDWSEQADGFGAYFNLLSRMSVLCQDEHGVVYSRRPLSGLPDMPIRAGTIGLVCAVIGTTTFDGFSNGGIWRTNEPSLQSLVADLGFNQTPALELTYSVGLVLCVLLVAGIYRLGIVGVHSVSTRFDMPELSRTFAHTLVPIGFAYVLAHYFSLLIWQGQAIGYSGLRPARQRRQLLRHERLPDRLHDHLLCGDLVRAGGGSGQRTRRWARARSRPCAQHLPQPRAGDSLAILDACGDGRVHELRSVAVVGGGDVSKGVEWPTC